MSRAAVTSRRLDLALVAALCAVGAAFRAPGFTKADLWFDDAWAALPAHVGFRDAVRMVVTTPGYTLGLREWLLVGPHATWWGQVPAFVFAVAGIAATYGLIRAYGWSRLAAVAAGVAIMAGPVTVAYADRLKEYPADLLCACLVLWLVERWRREPTSRHLLALGVAGAGSLWLSASTAVVVGGAAVMVVAVAWGRADLRRQAAGLVVALLAASVGLWLAFLRHVPSQLRTNWRTHGYLFGYASSHHLLYDVQQTFSGLAHGLVGLPIPWTPSGSAIRALPMFLAVVTIVVLVVLVEPPIAELVRARGREVPQNLAAAASILLAVLGTIAGIAPLGDGRTDEVLYPSLLVLLVQGMAAVARRATADTRTRDVARLGTGAVLAAGALAFGATHVAAYPPTGLASVVAQLRGHLLPGDVVVVDGYESFTWADEDLGLWSVSFQQGAVPWPMGFHVTSLNQDYVLSTNYLQPDTAIDELARHTRRVWYVGPTGGGYSTATPPDLWDFPYPTPVIGELHRLGWRGVGGVCCHAPGAYAWLFLFAPVPR